MKKYVSLLIIISVIISLTSCLYTNGKDLNEQKTTESAYISDAKEIKLYDTLNDGSKGSSERITIIEPPYNEEIALELQKNQTLRPRFKFNASSDFGKDYSNAGDDTIIPFFLEVRSIFTTTDYETWPENVKKEYDRYVALSKEANEISITSVQEAVIEGLGVNSETAGAWIQYIDLLDSGSTKAEDPDWGWEESLGENLYDEKYLQTVREIIAEARNKIAQQVEQLREEAETAEKSAMEMYDNWNVANRVQFNLEYLTDNGVKIIAEKGSDWIYPGHFACCATKAQLEKIMQGLFDMRFTEFNAEYNYTFYSMTEPQYSQIIG